MRVRSGARRTHLACTNDCCLADAVRDAHDGVYAVVDDEREEDGDEDEQQARTASSGRPDHDAGQAGAAM